MTELYPEKDRQAAVSAMRKSLLIYIVISIVCVTVCVLFVVLYKKMEHLLFLCAAVDFVITLGLFWFSVLYFSEVFPRYRGKLRIFKVLENAATKTVRMTYVSAGDTKVIEHVDYVECVFDDDGQKIELYLAPGWESVLKIGTSYELKLMGERVVAYSEEKRGSAKSNGGGK